ncbi:hypothetical protein C8F04DRAFT_1395766 [Mycena alexandri]|uniref:Protein kinase domain-containing protein n=1 Tax=Mycena alexandri TaxID=1745969 RepID=A0AAD6SUG0_9AGAR|nr:hypothetical protein C8F04DRAFT_1395766 [Mycena alexandri]
MPAFMNTEIYSKDEYVPPSNSEEPIFTSFGGGMFAGSQHFTIGGGTFNNLCANHYHPPPVKAPNFRTIPMGDIDLQQELIVTRPAGLVSHRRARNCVRRVYSAKINGRNKNLTVAMYEGDGAEEAWQQHIKMHMSLRHPNIVQIYGTARSGAMYAAIFHDDLIPIQLVASVSPIMTVYIPLCYLAEWRQACDYVKQVFEITQGLELYSTLSIHRSNGRLCAGFGPQPDGKNEGHAFFYHSYPRGYHAPVNLSLDLTSQEAAAINSLSLEEYHFICSFTLHRFRSGSFSSFATISCGAVFLFPPNSQPQEAEIASLSGAKFSGWGWRLGEERLNGVLMENDWTRFNTKDVYNGALTYTVTLPLDGFLAWPPQANHILSRFHITSNLEDYVLVHRVKFQVTIGSPRKNTPPAYLFRCPTTNFQLGPSSFKWPDCPAYWSLDPSGVRRLSTEEATRLRFPSFQLTTRVHEYSWDTSVYAGLRQFHKAKGFDPDSQDVARHLGCPLYQLSRDMDPLFAYVGGLRDDDEDWFDNNTDEGETNNEWEDAQRLVEVEDGDSAENSDANADEGPLNAYTEPPQQNKAEAYQEPAHNGAQDPNSAESRVLGNGIGFIHHIIGDLQQGLVIHTEDVDTDTISPFLV